MLEFPQGGPFEVSLHQQVKAEMRVAATGGQSIQVVDENGAALVGLGISILQHFTISGHCAWVVGDPLARLKTDANGRFELPLGDLKFAITIDPEEAIAVEREDVLPPNTLIGRFAELPNPIVAHHFKSVTLDLRAYQDGIAVPRISINACMALCSCGACCGQLMRSSQSGTIHLQAFKPEQYRTLSLINIDNGQTLTEIGGEEMASIAARSIDVQIRHTHQERE